ncbi:MAG: hypothetical protein JO166_04065 [Deltaproteobacteria bacterium]|nr:hypothetical protein [Deltaproteobacteria bacterium]
MPPEIVKAVRRLMGGIDLDPASNEIAQEVVGAARYFTKDDDALPHEWYAAFI